jgi:hypothetical protein
MADSEFKLLECAGADLTQETPAARQPEVNPRLKVSSKGGAIRSSKTFISLGCSGADRSHRHATKEGSRRRRHLPLAMRVDYYCLRRGYREQMRTNFVRNESSTE